MKERKGRRKNRKEKEERKRKSEKKRSERRGRKKKKESTHLPFPVLSNPIQRFSIDCASHKWGVTCSVTCHKFRLYFITTVTHIFFVFITNFCLYQSRKPQTIP